MPNTHNRQVISEGTRPSTAYDYYSLPVVEIVKIGWLPRSMGENAMPGQKASLSMLYRI